MRPSPPDPERPTDPCAAVSAAASELLLPDAGDPRLAPLRAHLADCDACRAELAMQASLVEQLRELPVAADARKSWASLRLALAMERRDMQRRVAESTDAGRELASLTVVALAVSAALVRLSPLTAHAFSVVDSLQLWLLPLLFLGFGATVALLALPLLRARRAHSYCGTRAP